MHPRFQKSPVSLLLQATIVITVFPAVAAYAEDPHPTAELVSLETKARRFWPSGLLKLIDNPTATADWFSTFPGFQISRGDRLLCVTSTDQANLIIDRFTELNAPKQQLILSYGQEPAEIGIHGRFPGQTVLGAILSIGGDDSYASWLHYFYQQRVKNPNDPYPPTLILFVGNPAIDFANLEVPPSVEVVPKHLPTDGYVERLRASGLPDDRIVPELNATRIAVERILVLRASEQKDSPVTPISQKTKNGDVPLRDAIKEFNKMAADDLLGCEQTPITEQEVVAAIRYWHREKGSPVTDQLFEEFKRIAETGKLSEGADFEVLRGMDPGGDHIFIGWWVRIMMLKSDGGTYSFPIRDHVMRTITVEQKLDEVTIALEQWQRDLPGRSRLERYQEELKKRVGAKQDVKRGHRTEQPTSH